MRLSILTIVLLIGLRLAIGWHLFYEGAWKEQHKDTWNSKGFLKGAKGPTGLASRWLAGDPDVERDGWKFEEKAPPAEPDPATELLQRFLVTIPKSEEQSPELWHKYLPEPLKKEWDDYFKRFVKHYNLNPEDTPFALCQAQCIFEKNKCEMVKWLKQGVKKMPPPPFAKGDTEVPKKTPERVQEYQDKVKEIQRLKEKEQPEMGSGAKEKLDKAVADEKALRAELLVDLDEQTAKMKEELRDPYSGVISYEQRRREPVLEAEAKPKGPPKEWERLDLIDKIVRWGLLGVGLCLLLGLLTRPACVVGIGFLVMFYLAMPPPPLGPDDPQAREHFYIINWNVIESVALLALATTRSGRWLGLDGLLHFLLPWNWRSTSAVRESRNPQAQSYGTPSTKQPAQTVTASSYNPTRRDISHGP